MDEILSEGPVPQGLYVTEEQVWKAAAPPSKQISKDELHVWRRSLEQSDLERSRLSLFLSSEEKARAARFVFAKDREHFEVARGTLRELLGSYLGSHAAEVQLHAGPFGKPFVPGTEIRFNLSHSHGLAVFAFAVGGEVGVDIEKVRAELAVTEIAGRYFSNTEREDLQATALEGQAEAFFRCWTRKEAYAKAHGRGLQISLDSFDVSLADEDRVPLRSADSMRWSIWSFKPAAGFAGAVVGESGLKVVRFLALPTTTQ